jgi:hypothetical protein
MSKSTVPNRTVWSHRTGCMFTCMRHQKQVTLQVILINIYKLNIFTSMELSGPTAKRARVGLGGSTLPAPRACPPSQQSSRSTLPAPRARTLSHHPSRSTLPAPRASTLSHHPSRSTLPAPRASSLLRWLLAAVCSRCRRTQMMRKGRTSSSR